MSCPACKEDLTGNHFFSSIVCLKRYTRKIFEWCDKHWLPRPECKIDFDNRFSLILMNCLWKTFCKARFNPDLNTCALRNTAKDFFKRELQLAQILYEKDYNTQLKLYKYDFNSIHFKFEQQTVLDFFKKELQLAQVLFEKVTKLNPIPWKKFLEKGDNGIVSDIYSEIKLPSSWFGSFCAQAQTAKLFQVPLFSIH